MTGPPIERGPEIARQSDGSYRLTMTTVVRRGRAEAFAALSDVRNLVCITPPWVRFHILTPLPAETRQGAIFDYALRIRWMSVKWRTVIMEYSPPHAFTDTQARGPFKEWSDRHTFDEQEDGSTLIRNDIRYRVRGGALVHRLLVRRDLLLIYRHERRMFHELLEGRA